MKRNNIFKERREINLNMIFYDKKKNRWRCNLCVKDFMFQIDAIRHLTDEHYDGERGGNKDEMSGLW